MKVTLIWIALAIASATITACQTTTDPTTGQQVPLYANSQFQDSLKSTIDAATAGTPWGAAGLGALVTSLIGIGGSVLGLGRHVSSQLAVVADKLSTMEALSKKG
jgi:hypothetical protein